jgi:hypothetical protein
MYHELMYCVVKTSHVWYINNFITMILLFFYIVIFLIQIIVYQSIPKHFLFEFIHF